MEKKHKIAQIYGYVICVIAVVTFLICAGALVNSVIDMGDPMHAYTFMQKKDLSSFEGYKVDALGQIDKDAAYIPADEELMKMYEAEREEVMLSANHMIRKNLIVNGLLIVVSVLLFWFHFSWMRRLERNIVPSKGSAAPRVPSEEDLMVH